VNEEALAHWEGGGGAFASKTPKKNKKKNLGKRVLLDKPVVARSSNQHLFHTKQTNLEVTNLEKRPTEHNVYLILHWL